MTRWNVDQEMSGSGNPTQSLLFSFHFFRAALMRRWRTIVVFVVGGAALAFIALQLMPPGSSASTGIVLAHRDGEDPATAMATDISLLRTRSVAQDAIDALNLHMSPDGFQNSVTVTAPTPEVLVIKLNAPTPEDALTRLQAFSSAYMAFRSEQVRSESDGLIFGDKDQIKDLQAQSETLTKQYDAIAGRGDADNEARASDILSQRSQLLAQITTLQQNIKQTALVTESILAASHTIDPPAVDPPHTAKRLVLILMSGVIGGGAVGVGLTLLTSLMSRRLRRRDEVAMALGRPVRFSTRALVHRWPRRGVTRDRDLDVLAAGMSTALTMDESVSSLALVSVGATREAANVVCRVATQLAKDHRVCVVDLSERGALSNGRSIADGFAVVRPSGTVATATGPLSLVASYERSASLDAEQREQLDDADIVLILDEAELGVGAEPLSTWTDRAVLLVKAGRVSAEFLDSLSRIFKASGVEVDFAMLVGADASDESPGFPAALASDSRVRRTS
jgi:capsular polysaccharide biosynthesis protein